MDLLGSFSAPNKSTLQGMGPVHASKAKRKGLRLDHLFNDREDARKRLEADMADFFGMMANLKITEAELLTKAKANSKIQEHVLNFITAEDKASYVLDLYLEHVVNNADFPQRKDVSYLLRSKMQASKSQLVNPFFVKVAPCQST